MEQFLTTGQLTRLCWQVSRQITDRDKAIATTQHLRYPAAQSLYRLCMRMPNGNGLPIGAGVSIRCSPLMAWTRTVVVVRPHVGHDDYLRLNLACDAMLDSVRWSGGNTSLDAIACGLPIATRPGAFMRGRQSAGMLEMIGAAELVAADEEVLVANAVRLAEDRSWRADSARMRDGADRMFNDVEPVAALAEALDRC